MKFFSFFFVFEWILHNNGDSVAKWNNLPPLSCQGWWVLLSGALHLFGKIHFLPPAWTWCVVFVGWRCHGHGRLSSYWILFVVRGPRSAKSEHEPTPWCAMPPTWSVRLLNLDFGVHLNRLILVFTAMLDLLIQLFEHNLHHCINSWMRRAALVTALWRRTHPASAEKYSEASLLKLTSTTVISSCLANIYCEEFSTSTVTDSCYCLAFVHIQKINLDQVQEFSKQKHNDIKLWDGTAHKKIKKRKASQRKKIPAFFTPRSLDTFVVLIFLSWSLRAAAVSRASTILQWQTRPWCCRYSFGFIWSPKAVASSRISLTLWSSQATWCENLDSCW